MSEFKDMRCQAYGSNTLTSPGRRCLLPSNHREDHCFDVDLGGGRQIFKGGATSTKIPGFKYIPRIALERLARRFELGLERHKEHSWNPLNPDSEKMLDDKEWLIERLSHVIHHCYKEIEHLVSNDSQDIEGRDDNAAAIMWGGACLIAADERRKKVYEMGLKSASQDRD